MIQSVAAAIVGAPGTFKTAVIEADRVPQFMDRDAGKLARGGKLGIQINNLLSDTTIEGALQRDAGIIAHQLHLLPVLIARFAQDPKDAFAAEWTNAVGHVHREELRGGGERFQREDVGMNQLLTDGVPLGSRHSDSIFFFLGETGIN